MPGLDLSIIKGKKGDSAGTPNKDKGDRATPVRVNDTGPRIAGRGDGQIRTDRTGLNLPQARKLEQSESRPTVGKDKAVAKPGDFTSALAREFRSRVPEATTQATLDKSGRPKATDLQAGTALGRPADFKTASTGIPGLNRLDILKAGGTDRTAARAADFTAGLAKEYRTRIPEQLSKPGKESITRALSLRFETPGKPTNPSMKPGADIMGKPFQQADRIAKQGDSLPQPADRPAKLQSEAGKQSDRRLAKDSTTKGELMLPVREMRVAAHQVNLANSLLKVLRTEISRPVSKEGVARPIDNALRGRLPVASRTLDAIARAPGFKATLTKVATERTSITSIASKAVQPGRIRLPELKLTAERTGPSDRITARSSKPDQTSLLRDVLKDQPISRTLKTSFDRTQISRPTTFLRPGCAANISWLRLGRALNDANARLAAYGTTARLSIRDMAFKMPKRPDVRSEVGQKMEAGRPGTSLKLSAPAREVARKVLSMRSEDEHLEELRRAGMVADEKRKKVETFIARFDTTVRNLPFKVVEPEPVLSDSRSDFESYLEALEFTDILGDKEALEAIAESDGEGRGGLSQGRQTYVVQKDDTLESIALKTLGDAILALLIMQINKGRIHSTMEDGHIVINLQPGTTLYLPTMDEIQEFRMRLASGGMSIFQYGSPSRFPEEQIEEWEQSGQ